MEQKTRVTAEEGKQDLVITRDFDLPVALLFKAYAESEMVSQWMGTNVLKLESQPEGAYRFETKDQNGNVVFAAGGVIHTFLPDKRIVRTFEMDNVPFGVQLEVLDFEKLTEDTSRLQMHAIYESVAQRDQVLRLPFKQGVNMAHNRLQEVVGKLK